MFNSVRLRLTLWYVGVLALVLLAFSFGIYVLLAHNLDIHFDSGLRSTIEAMTAKMQQEIEEGETPKTAAEGTIEDLRFPLQSLSVYDPNGTLLAEMRAIELSKPLVLPKTFIASDKLAFHTLLISENAQYHNYRVAMQKVSMLSGKVCCIIIVSQSYESTIKELETVRHIFFITLPIALLFAGVSGWLLAHKSLAPVIAMSERAQKIGAQDMTQRLPIGNPHDELGKMAKTFNDLLARLSDSFNQQKQFMADASHELRTPLNVMQLATEVTLRKAHREESEYREALVMVQEQTKQLTHIVEDMFLLARTDAGHRDLEQTHFYLDELVAETVHTANILAVNKDIKIKTFLSEEAFFYGDEGLLRQMVLNLIDNAIKYTLSGGTISISLIQCNLTYELIIKDTGIGIPTTSQPYIFERFYRVDKSRSHKDMFNSGAGLGLCIARWIAQAHKGNLELRNSDAQGSSFVATLPISHVQ